LSFEDASGREEVYLHAQRDLTTNVLNDDAQDIRHDRKVEIGNNDSLSVKQNRQVQIGNNSTVKIAQTSSETVGREMSLNVGERLVITVGQSRLEMTSDGKVTLTGSEFDFSTSGNLGIHGNPLDTSG
jgi:type VI secretion system secreted protein VgrG